MKRTIFVIACLALGACAAEDNEGTVVADSAAIVASDTAAMAADVRAAVEEFYDVLTSGSAEALDSLLHPAHLSVHGNGSLSSHDERIDHHEAGRIKVTRKDHDIVAVQTFGNDFALAHVNARSEGESHGRKWEGGATMILGFARTGNGPWELVYHQIVQVEPNSI